MGGRLFPIPVGAVFEIQIIREHHRAIFDFGNEQRIQERTGHQRAFGRPSGLAGVEHFFRALHEISEVHVRPCFLRTRRS